MSFRYEVVAPVLDQARPTLVELPSPIGRYEGRGCDPGAEGFERLVDALFRGRPQADHPPGAEPFDRRLAHLGPLEENAEPLLEPKGLQGIDNIFELGHGGLQLESRDLPLIGK